MAMFDGNGGNFDPKNPIDYHVYKEVTDGKQSGSNNKSSGDVGETLLKIVTFIGLAIPVFLIPIMIVVFIQSIKK